MGGHEEVKHSIEKHRIDPSHNQSNRPYPPEENRGRVVRACDQCRRLKEKCNGGNPCARCLRYDRECQFSDAFKQKRIRPSKRRGNLNGVQPREKNSSLPLKPETVDQEERGRALEQIAKYFTGVDQPDQAQLNQAIAMLKSSLESQNTNTLGSTIDEEAVVDPDDAMNSDSSPSHLETVYSGELSHCSFSLTVQQRIRGRLREAVAEELRIATPGEWLGSSLQLRSQDSVVFDAVSLFPTIEVAFFLIDVFFEFAQTNYSYVDEQSLRRKVDDFYFSSILVTYDDAPWVCAVLMMFAVGTQFAHLDTVAYELSINANDEDGSATTFPDDDLAAAFYHKATHLIPDIITKACVDSVQALLLLGVYTLPIDPGGLSCTYFGIAVKLATQIGMHLKNQRHLDVRELEIRRRIWWTACTLERRICILHGRHVSIKRSEIGSDLPTDLVELRPRERINTFENTIAMIQLTELLEMARDSILRFKKARASRRASTVQRIKETRRKLEEYWNALPEIVFCRDLTPGRPLFRFNVHLALTYHLVHIFMGRSFIFRDVNSSVKSDDDIPGWSNLRNVLVKDCLRSASSIISLSQLLEDEIGLARSSYTEFTSCCAALLVVLAERISSETAELKEVCGTGIKLLKKMSMGIFSRSSEKLAVESLEMAVHRLDRKRRETVDEESGQAYEMFRHWVSLQQVNVGTALPRPWQGNDMLLDALEGESFGPNFAGTQSADLETSNRSPSFSLGEFASVPGLDGWFEYGLH